MDDAFIELIGKIGEVGLQICADNENDFTPENRKFLKQCTNAVACVKSAFADVLDSNKGRKT